MLQPVASWGDRSPHRVIRCAGGRRSARALPMMADHDGGRRSEFGRPVRDPVGIAADRAGNEVATLADVDEQRAGMRADQAGELVGSDGVDRGHDASLHMEDAMLQPVASWGDRNPHEAIRCAGGHPVKRAAYGPEDADTIPKGASVRYGWETDVCSLLHLVLSTSDAGLPCCDFDPGRMFGTG